MRSEIPVRLELIRLGSENVNQWFVPASDPITKNSLLG